MTPTEIAELAAKCWKANAKHAEMIAEKAMEANDIPLVVTVLEGMPKFLADLQRDSFVLGFAAAITLAMEAIQEVRVQ